MTDTTQSLSQTARLRAVITAQNRALHRKNGTIKGLRDQIEAQTAQLKKVQAENRRLCADKERWDRQVKKEWKERVECEDTVVLVAASSPTFSEDALEVEIKAEPRFAHFGPSPTTRSLRHTIKNLRQQLNREQQTCAYLRIKLKDGPEHERAKRREVITKLNEAISRKKNELVILRDRAIAYQDKLAHHERAANFLELLTVRVLEQVCVLKKLVNGIDEGCDLNLSAHDCVHRYSHGVVTSHIESVLSDIQGACLRAFDTVDADLEFWDQVWSQGTVVVDVNNGNGGTNGNGPKRKHGRKPKRRRTIQHEGRVYSYARVGYQVTHRVVLMPDQEIHHKDGDSMNDEPDNWEVKGFEEHEEEHKRSNGVTGA